MEMKTFNNKLPWIKHFCAVCILWHLFKNTLGVINFQDKNLLSLRIIILLGFVKDYNK